ncbi:MAG: hypothetical protein CMN78_04615 [Spirochaetales bacterium]|nr:hypothetical protein [Spirochaetales bacterium]
MEIKINKEAIDFTLEQERVLGEVVDGVEHWLATNGFTLTEITRDDAKLPLSDRLEWQNDSIETVDSLDFTALHPNHIAYDKLAAIQQYMDLLQEADAPDSPAFLDLLKGAEDVAELIDEAMSSDTVGDLSIGNRFLSLTDTKGSVGGVLAEEQFGSLLTYASELGAEVTARLREIADPMAEIKTTAKDLSEAIQSLSDVAVLLQTGNDREALSHLIQFVDLLQKLIRIVRYIGSQSIINLAELEIDGESLIGFGSTINGLLNELNDAMLSGDTVLIGDLLEYEIAPKLESLLNALKGKNLL